MSIIVSIKKVEGIAALAFEAEFPNQSKAWEIQLPTWRPGRYELGDFAQYLTKMVGVAEGNQEEVNLEKVDLHRWTVPAGVSKLRWVFHAEILNAGSTYVSEELQYVNPVNCMVYDPERESLGYEITLSDVPENWDLATALPYKGRTLFARDMQHVMDSPWMAAPELWHEEYKVKDDEKEVDFHVWSYGCKPPRAEKFMEDHKAFTLSQIEFFGSFPAPFYHFLYLLPPAMEVRHGVEHEDSTVIALGPADKINSDYGYDELVSIASHELYHAWNVKRIRPSEWTPYDFTGPCPSKLGYIAEGVTTYMGDLFLFESGCIDLENWSAKMVALLTHHLNNPGRLNMSVADSSYDTWLDGYTPGVPGRKGSIYVEGAVLAFLCDVRIMRETSNKKSLSSAMKLLWDRYGKSRQGVTAEIYWDTLAEVAGTRLDSLRRDYCEGTKDSWSDLVDAMKANGLLLSKTTDDSGKVTPHLVRTAQD
jgi:predicted metalloprotease with PDZ domain